MLNQPTLAPGETNKQGRSEELPAPPVGFDFNFDYNLNWSEFAPAPVVPSDFISDFRNVGKDGFGGGCSRGMEAISAYLDGELDPDSRDETETHLSRCPQCAATYAALLETDAMIQREWRDNAPLPSAFAMQGAIDSIMDALPPVPAPVFAPKRVHAKARWMRFATGIAGIVALIGLLWSSYRFGFTQGRLSILPQFAPRPDRDGNGGKGAVLDPAEKFQSQLMKLKSKSRMERSVFAFASAAFASNGPLSARCPAKIRPQKTRLQFAA